MRPDDLLQARVEPPPRLLRVLMRLGLFDENDHREPIATTSTAQRPRARVGQTRRFSLP